MIARIEIVYGSKPKLVQIAEDPDNLPWLHKIFGSLLPTAEHLKLEYMWPGELLIDMETDGPELAARGIEFVVKNFKGTMPLTSILPGGQGETKVYVQIHHIGLLSVNEVQLEENCCTDRLQTLLDAGWRILCVCPPNAQRRPDYILGRTKTE